MPDETINMVLGPTTMTGPSSPATSEVSKPMPLRLFVAGKGGQVRQAQNAAARRSRKRASKKACATARESNSNPVSLARSSFPCSCSIPFHFHLVIAAALLACFVHPRSSLPCARRQQKQEGIAAGRMSDRELRPLRSIRITGDGRCLFRSVAYGACLRRGKQLPSESIQKELADELRAKVADEFVKRRGDTEWFLEGDFERYVSQMRKPHVWGGEPELLMCSHVLRMPITVYMHTNSSDSPRIIAEYGQEYGKDNLVHVLYDGCGHYDALQPSLVRTQSRLRGV